MKSMNGPVFPLKGGSFVILKGEIRIMDKEEYYKRIGKINNRFKTDRVSADEEYQLVCQRNYLSTKYIEHLEQQCKKQKEVIDKAIEYIKEHIKYECDNAFNGMQFYSYHLYDFNKQDLMNILNEVSE